MTKWKALSASSNKASKCLKPSKDAMTAGLNFITNKWSPPLGRLGQPEAGTSVGTHITPNQITQSCMRYVYNTGALATIAYQ